MNPHASERGWLAVSCAGDGAIVQILHDDFGLATAGSQLHEIVDRGSSEKAERFLTAIRERQLAAGWELNVPNGKAVRPLLFAGAAADGSLLVLAAPGSESLATLFDELASANLTTTHALRSMLDEQRSMSAALRSDHQLYDELSRLNNDLINRERELARKTAALERIAAEKSRLVAIAAHDLRNPLTVIASYADLLRMDAPLEGEQLEYLEEITRSARFMMELVEELLDSSRLEAGVVDMDLRDIDLVAAAEHAAVLNRLRADRKEIVIAFESNDPSAIIRADLVKLRQILNNLIVNAIKFSPARTTVTVRVQCEERQASVEVEDQGIGIPESELSAIFEPFKTLGSAGTAGEKSTGLGLSIVRQLVTLHGASVTVKSTVGTGSRFRVSFPRRG